MENENDPYRLMPRDSKIFESGPSSSFSQIWGYFQLHKCDRHNLRLCVDAHRRPPRTSAAGSIDQEIAKPFQPIVITPVDPCGDETEKKDLTLVGVA